MSQDPDSSSRRRVSAHRARLRAAGLRPVQIWVPDVRSSKFDAEARRQSEAVARSEHAAEDEAFIAAISLGDE
ncbi:MAG: antitoxin MazE family protein [Acidimicrobiales bacterium]